MTTCGTTFDGSQNEDSFGSTVIDAFVALGRKMTRLCFVLLKKKSDFDSRACITHRICPLLVISSDSCRSRSLRERSLPTHRVKTSHLPKLFAASSALLAAPTITFRSGRFTRLARSTNPSKTPINSNEKPGALEIATIRVDNVFAVGEIHSGNANLVYALARMGEVGTAPRHAPLLTALKPVTYRSRIQTAKNVSSTLPVACWRSNYPW